MKKKQSIKQTNLVLFLAASFVIVSFFIRNKKQLVPLAYQYAYSLASQLDVTGTIKAPSTFGKTHFILGHSNESVGVTQEAPNNEPAGVIQEAPNNLPLPLLEDGRIHEVFFVPDDNVRDILLYLIDHEQERIAVAVFTFTDPKIAQALMQVQERGIKVELVTDLTALQSRSTKILTLADHGIDIFMYDPSQVKSGHAGCMHNKFVIFDKNIYNKAIVWSGSCNFTRFASQFNQENVMVFNEKRLVDKFAHQFQRLKTRSHRHILSTNVHNNAINVAH